ncbi:YhdP family protein [Halopseudomonas pertucinogena]|uniref:TIGR02099 family protein n=1 Tax=Halopseudomonas pertucinogena TaxID=86175 RepID=A0ABQ2CHV5_9GAMM|nr:YhdP family protein [Halopseudomonas pertucinogena]GGI88017.1 TIGR02099 family protein [Halopseudomonas pertucinogena]
MNGARWLRRLLDGLILLLISWLLLTAAYVSLGRQFVPALADYQDELVQWVQQQTGRAIELDSLQAEMQGSQPVLTLQGLRVHEGADRNSPVLLELQHVTARVDVFASLWQREPVMDALQLEGLELEFIEDEEGSWRLSGLGQSDPNSGGLDRALQRVFDQRRITLLDTSIRITPWAQPQWVFSDGDLTLLTRDDRHRLDARMRLPDQQLVSLQIRGRLPDRDWRRADMAFFAELPPSDWHQWLPAELLAQARIQRMVAGGQLWGQWRNVRLERMDGVLRMPVVELDLPRPAPATEDLELQFQLQLEDDQQRLDIQQLSLRLGEQRWPDTRLQLTRHPQHGDWQARIDRVPLQLLGQWLPAALPHEGAAQILDTLAPEGELQGVLVRGGKLADFADWNIQAALHEVGVQAWEGVPAMDGMSGVIAGKPAGGELRVDSGPWSMHLPRLFPERWHYHRLQGGLTWRWSQPQGLELTIPGAEAEGEEGIATTRLHLQLPPPGGTPTMDLRVALNDTRAEFHGRYLPTESSAMEPALTEWLRATELSGDVPQAIFSYQGPLRGATREERAIRLYARLQQGRLNFQPGWPALEQVDATLHLHNLDMNISEARGQLLQTSLDNIQVALGRTADQALKLSIRGDIDGPLADGLHIMQQTPLARLTGDPLEGWTGEGSLQGNLQLGVPLGGASEPDVHLQLQASASQLNIAQARAPLRDLSAEFIYQHGTGLSSKNITAQFLGEPVRAQLGVRDGTHQLRMDGSHSMEQLRSWPMLEAVPEKLASGRAAWTAQLLLGEGLRRLVVQSDLRDVQLDLPGELAKRSGDRLPSRLQLDMGQTGRWQFQLGDDLRGILLERDGVLAGDIRYRQGIPQQPATRGIAVAARFDRVDVDQWRDWWRPDLLSGTGAGGSGPGAGPGEQLISRVQISAGRLSGFGLDLQNLDVLATPRDSGWQLTAEHPQLSGRVLLPAQGAPIELDLQRLVVARPQEDPVDTHGLVEPLLPEDPLKDFNPASVPAMRVSIDELHWGDELVGATAFNLRPATAALDISDIDLSLRGGLQVMGSMRWDESRSRFDGTLAATDIGRVLSAWGYAPSVRSSSFGSQVSLSWPGSPAWFALKRSSGSLSLQAEDGTLDSGESSADALRVFGLLNFNALTRRLRLDFSDLFGKGVAYDTFSGEAVLTNGLLQTLSPLVMDGPSVKLQLDGNLDLPADRVDMGLLVTLPVTNNLPLAAIIAGAPQIGGVLFLVDRILGDRVARFASVRYRVSGSWKQPNVEFDRAFDDKPALED